jgi:hypothetical protein
MQEIIKEKGKTSYYLNGVLHRLDGPAIERIDGINDWYINGKLKGLQLQDGNGPKFSYYMDRVCYSEENFKRKILHDALQENVPNINSNRKKIKL